MSIKNDDRYPILTNLIDDLMNLRNSYVGALKESAREEVIAARKGYDSLEDRLDGIDTQLSEKASQNEVNEKINQIELQLTQKASQQEVNEKISQVNSQLTQKASQNEVNEKFNQVNSQLADIADLKGYLDNSITNINTSLSKATSDISILQDQINLKVSQIDIDNSIAALKIGGRNLLKNSAFANGITSWSPSHGGTLIVSPENDEIALSCPFKYGKSVKFTQKVGQAFGFISQNVENLEVGETYTFSGWIYASSEVPTSRLHVGKFDIGTSGWTNGNANSVNVRDNWTKFTYSFKATNTKAVMIAGIAASTTTVSYIVYGAGFKLEKGNKATDWTPAPEDVQEQLDKHNTKISTAESSITQLTNSIALKVDTSTFNSYKSTIDTKMTTLEQFKSETVTHLAQKASQQEVNEKFNQVDSQLAQKASIELAKGGRTATIVIAASDSTEKAKASADYVCDGINDEEEINLALQQIETVSGKVYLRNGTYNINHLTYSGSDDWGYHGIIIKAPNVHRHVVIEGENQPWFGNYPDYNLQNGVRIKIAQTAFDEVPAGVGITGIGAIPNLDGTEEFPGKIVTLKNLGIILPTNQRPNVIGVYLERVSGMEAENVFVQTDVPFTQLQLPAPNTIGILGPLGSKIAEYKLTTCYVQGFERGFDLPGEHILAYGLYANYCKYPYYLAKSGSYVYHTNVFIKCGHEDCLYGPFIGAGAREGSLFEFIAYDIEFDTQGIWAQQGGAMEEVPGNSRGTVTYTATQANIGISNQTFWEPGHGYNFKTWNSTDRISGTSNQRPTSPALYHEYFDTTIGRKIIWDGTKWVGSEGWKTPTLLNGWVNYGGTSAKAGYTKDASGIVHLKGAIKGGSTEPNSPIMQLDVGYRPSEQLIFLVPSAKVDDATGLAPCCIMIKQDGYVIIMMEGTGNAWLSLDGISFYAG